ncbi:unnamed protein product [Fraxinus pennsylvanica]|uniref:HMA domain-containing protein n=1 Tax=Fraxinus pennsylvanica TaxID=56036 RepID=A0AAD2E9J0_9LAMI|nr:unnamed protein product [Fraxinus pennsylvanica]
MLRLACLLDPITKSSNCQIQQDESGHFHRRETKLDRLRKESDNPSGSNTRSKALKMVIKLEMRGEKEKAKAMKLVSSFPGILSVAVDLENELTVVGDFDPYKVEKNLRKLWPTEIVTIGPAK